jgi:hypothetical protein
MPEAERPHPAPGSPIAGGFVDRRCHRVGSELTVAMDAAIMFLFITSHSLRH